jgi:hypothetical protein
MLILYNLLLFIFLFLSLLVMNSFVLSLILVLKHIGLGRLILGFLLGETIAEANGVVGATGKFDWLRLVKGADVNGVTAEQLVVGQFFAMLVLFVGAPAIDLIVFCDG